MPLEDSLKAIGAADRLRVLGTVDGKALLHRRLTVFYGGFAILATLAAIFGRVRFDPHTAGVLPEVQAAHAVALCSVYLALQFRVREGALLRVLDALATLATAITAAVGLSIVERVVTVDVSAVSFFVLFFVARAALVPSSPWTATLIAGVSAVPFTLGLAAMYRRAGLEAIPDPEAATFAALRSMTAGVAGVYLVSRTIYGLRSSVEKAVQLGQYIVHEKIGEGGMGAVYRASHAMLKRPTAIKVIPPDRAGRTAIARFEREVIATSRLTHPNNVAIYDYGRTAGGTFYYAMELIDGEDLARLVEREGPQPVARSRHILRQLAGALGEAHDSSLVHRDVKPANIMLSTRGGVRDFVKVLDFGLVKDISNPDEAGLTHERALAGTPLYLAPESIHSPATIGPAVDVYAFGCVAYFLLTGRPPFVGDNLVSICTAHMHEIPDPPSMFTPEVPPELDALVLRCLEKQPSARPTTRALERSFADDLR